MKRDNSLDDDVKVLFSEMRITPKEDKNAEVDDVLIQIQRVSSRKEIESFERQRYLNNVKSLGSTNQGSINHGSSRGRNANKYSTEASKISRVLEKSGDQPWVESVRSSFRSQTQEMLFRSMKVLVPERKVGDVIPRRPSSANGLRAGGSRTLESYDTKPALSVQHAKVCDHSIHQIILYCVFVCLESNRSTLWTSPTITI